jgi:hypothetical protein
MPLFNWVAACVATTKPDKVSVSLDFCLGLVVQMMMTSLYRSYADIYVTKLKPEAD